MLLIQVFYLSALAQAANILLTNDDGWAEINIRTFYDALTASKNSVLISAPAVDKSGTGSSDSPSQPLGTTGCEFGSCPPNSPATGTNSSNPSFNYVNSYPVTSVKYGLTNLSSSVFGGKPDIVVAGPNVGSNLGGVVLISGTVGAAAYGATQATAAIAFSGTTGTQTSWEVDPVPAYSKIYAALATNITNTYLAGDKTPLPIAAFLNVNFPAAGDGTQCTSVQDFKFVLSTINDNQNPTVQICGQSKLPTESTVVNTIGCFASISVGLASNKSDADAHSQALVLNKLGFILSCLDGSKLASNATTNSTTTMASTTGTSTTASSTSTSTSGASIDLGYSLGYIGAGVALFL